MRVMLIHRYFWPDTPPYAHILHEIAVHLGKNGHEVRVLTCQPSYNREAAGRAPARERLGPGVEVRRWPVVPDRRSAAFKVLNLVLFCARLMLARRQFVGADVVMAASTPPILVAKLAGWLARRHGASFIYHKQDVYPEVVTAPGIMRDGRLAALLRRLDGRTERKADRVVVLSEDMAATVRSRGSDPGRIVTINNFDPWSLDEAQPSSADTTGRTRSRSVSDPLHVAFAGNLGRFQNLETVFDALVELRQESGVRFDFFGDGALRPTLDRLVQIHGLTTVRVHGYRPPDEVAEFLRDRADVGIVSLAPGVIRAAFPSKTMSYLRNGCPVLALVEADSELAMTITSSRAGLYAAPTDFAAVATVLRRLVAKPSLLEGARERAYALYREQFSPDRQLERWLDLIQGVAAGGKR